LLDFLKSPVEAFQDFIVLAFRAIQDVFRAPHYTDDIFIQMDIIGIGSLPAVILIGFFMGGILGLQMSRALATYGATGQVGQIVAITLVRELGPVMTALMIAGRVGSGIASELGSMKVTEQIDAMRALGTDPGQKLVTPRMIAGAVVVPLLTIMADFLGLVGGFVIAYFVLNMTPSEYWNTAWRSLAYNDVVQGLLKPLIFAMIITLVGCFYGIRTTGGTQGVGRSTTSSVVVSYIWIIIIDLFIGRIFLNI
jgi:phospholipid/cholesterol/gamma-HCH transport system permease protein